jgi:cell division protein FtsL
MKKRKMKKAKKINLEKILYIVMILAIAILTIYALVNRFQEIRTMNISLFEFLFPTMR